MKKYLIAFGVFLFGMAIVGSTLAVQGLLPTEKESLEQSLTYVAKQKVKKIEARDSLNELIAEDEEEYKRLRCRLFHLKEADGESTSPESYSLCVGKR